MFTTRFVSVVEGPYWREHAQAKNTLRELRKVVIAQYDDWKKSNTLPYVPQLGYVY